MRQSTIIFGAIVFAFIVYITLRGQLQSYLSLFTKKSGETLEAGASNAGDDVNAASRVDEIVKRSGLMGLPDIGGFVDKYGYGLDISEMGDILEGVFK